MGSIVFLVCDPSQQQCKDDSDIDIDNVFYIDVRKRFTAAGTLCTDRGSFRFAWHETQRDVVRLSAAAHIDLK